MNQALPFVSVIIPCRNEVRYIRSMIRSVLYNDYPRDRLEVFVIDGMSTDGTREVLNELTQTVPQLKILDNPAFIVPAALNIGIREARGDFILRMDCHAVYDKEYIRKCVEVALRTNAANVGGYITTVPGANTSVAKAISLATSCAFGVGNSTFRLHGPEREVDTVPFGMFRRTIFKTVGLFDERLIRNQDIEMNSRIRKAGGGIIISPEIKLSYYNRAGYPGIMQQSFHNGFWNPYTFWLVGGALGIRHFVPLFFIFGWIFLLVLLAVWPPAGWLMIGYLGLYVAVALVFIYRDKLYQKGSVPLILGAFLAIHMAYGFGSLWAILKLPILAFKGRRQNPGKPLPDRRT